MKESERREVFLVFGLEEKADERALYGWGLVCERGAMPSLEGMASRVWICGDGLVVSCIRVHALAAWLQTRTRGGEGGFYLSVVAILIAWLQTTDRLGMKGYR